MPEPNNEPDRFPATRWSLVLTASGEDEPEARRALSELCEAYWYPIYCFIRNRGRSASDAEDLTQEFLAGLIERNALARADASRGKLRAFLLNAVKNFVVNRHRWEQAAKRGGGQVCLSIDAALAERHFADEAQAEGAPDELFERAWARSLLDRVREEIATAYRNADKADLYAALEPYVRFDSDEPSYFELADRLDMSMGSLRVAVFRLRQRYRELLEAEIADTLEDPSQISAEIDHLMGLFSR